MTIRRFLLKDASKHTSEIAAVKPILKEIYKVNGPIQKLDEMETEKRNSVHNSNRYKVKISLINLKTWDKYIDFLNTCTNYIFILSWFCVGYSKIPCN